LRIDVGWRPISSRIRLCSEARFGKRGADLVKDPEHLLGVLEDLVRDDDVDRLRRERERLALDVDRVRLGAFLTKHRDAWSERLERQQPRGALDLPGDLEVVASPRTDVEHVAIRTRPLEEETHA
jgi:hypothetical protein